MRHRKRGRKLGRNNSHRHALMRNLAKSLLITVDADEDAEGKPAVPGRIKTTMAKAKEVQPFVERLITIARRTLIHERASEEFQSGPNETPDKSSSEWQEWAAARAPVVAARRRVQALLGGGDPDSKKAVDVLFSTLAPRFEFRAGGYTRVLRSAQRRLGDGGATAILEFVGDDEVSMVRPETASAESESDSEVETAVEEANGDGQEADSEADSETGQETEDDKD